MNNRFYFVTLAVAALCLGLAFGAYAAQSGKNPCSEDIAKFCKDVKPGGGAIMDCLEKHESELSDACKDYEATMKGRRVEKTEEVRALAKVRRFCRDDVTRFCKDIKPGGGGIAQCLGGHENELSTPCKDSLNGLKEETKKAK